MNEAIIESTVRAVDLLKYVVDSLAPAEIMAYAPDIVTVGAAKAGIFLVRVSLEGSKDARQTTLTYSSHQACRPYREISQP